MDEETSRLEQQWEARGEADVKAELDSSNQAGPETAKARAWLNKKEATRQDEQRQAMFASVRASSEAAQVSRASAEASRRSAFWTMIAAIAAAAGVLLNAAINLGWMDWARHMP
jgi:hypothetical protein